MGSDHTERGVRLVELAFGFMGHAKTLLELCGT